MNLLRRPLVALLLAAAPCFAQTLPATPAPSETTKANPPTEATVTLSPFEVNTSRDTGFASASSLAGGRLALDLRDTPASYSVINRELIDALNLTDLQSAAEWSVGSTLNVDNGQQNFFAAPINYTTPWHRQQSPTAQFFPAVQQRRQL
jgi:outer membrane receptor for ferric coprogen and ferric-rhodotorulic acid